MNREIYTGRSPTCGPQPNTGSWIICNRAMWMAGWRMCMIAHPRSPTHLSITGTWTSLVQVSQAAGPHWPDHRRGSRPHSSITGSQGLLARASQVLRAPLMRGLRAIGPHWRKHHGCSGSPSCECHSRSWPHSHKHHLHSGLTFQSVNMRHSCKPRGLSELHLRERHKYSQPTCGLPTQKGRLHFLHAQFNFFS